MWQGTSIHGGSLLRFAFKMMMKAGTQYCLRYVQRGVNGAEINVAQYTLGIQT
jgi:hypothetical protein